MADVGVFEAILTQLQITRYVPDPVPSETIDRVIEAATKAPSGGNMQEWESMVVTDREVWLSDHGKEPQPGPWGPVLPPTTCPENRKSRTCWESPTTWRRWHLSPWATPRANSAPPSVGRPRR